MNNQKGKISAIMVYAVMLAAVFALAVPVNVGAVTIVVPDDYPTIQEAMEAASSGDTVCVRPGTYYEHVTIGKSLTLEGNFEGDDTSATIIDAGGTGNAIHVIADDITIQGFTATNGQFGILFDDVGIGNVLISDCILTSNKEDGIHGRYGEENVIIENCELSHNGGSAIWAHHFDYSVIRNCHVFENGYDPAMPHTFGIDIAWCHDSSIVDCEVYSNEGHYAIVLDSTWDCIVEGCNVYDNEANGITIYRWWNGYSNTIRDNIVQNNEVGIHMNTGHLAYDNLIYHNYIIDNITQATDGATNKWDNGYPSGGNYWSDYTGVDIYSGPNQDQSGSDGIGDTPYWIEISGKDNYPLVLTPTTISATIDIDPDTLNLKSKGKWITCYIELPEDYDVRDINVGTVLLENLIEVEHSDIQDSVLMVEFNRQDVIDYIELVLGVAPPDDVTLTVTGEVAGTPFEGSDTIRVIKKGK